MLPRTLCATRIAFSGLANLRIACNRLSSSQPDFMTCTKEAQRLQNDLDNEKKLTIYGLYKQATIGDAQGKRPGMIDFVGRAKYDAWNKLRGLTKDEAQQKYCEIIGSLIGKTADSTENCTAPDGLTPVRGLDVSVDRNILRLTLNRPNKYNAITWEMYDGITNAFNYANDNRNITVTVLTGNGKYFSSGNDLSNFAAVKSPDDIDHMAQEGARVLNRYVNAYINHNKVLIALVNGPAVGISVTVLGLCDLVLASDKATFHTPFTSLGQSPEACSSYTFPRIMGHSKAAEMLLFGRKLSALEAYERNLVSEVLPSMNFLEEAQRRVEQIRALYPESLVCNKRLIREIDRQKLLAQCEIENTLLAERWKSSECIDAITKFISRKK